MAARFKSVTALQRFEEKYIPEPNSGCWLWIACVHGDGYGRFSWGGGTIQAHHAAWMLFVGAIPVGQWVLHKCDNPGCVNPGHLFLGDNLTNMRDAARKGRIWMQKRPHESTLLRPSVRKDQTGAGNNHARLTDEQVIEIRLLYREGLSSSVIAARFGLRSPGHVRMICSGKLWKHVPTPRKVSDG